MNLLYRSAQSVNGSQKRILEHLRKDGIFERCVVIDYGNEDYNKQFGYYRIDSAYCYENRYDCLCDMDSLPEPDPGILKEMERYKGMCFHISGLRPCDLYVGDYFSLEMNYIRAVKFWNYIIDTGKIDLAFFPSIPHWEYEFILYVLLKVKGIPTLLVQASHIPGLYCVGTSIESMGYNTKALYGKKGPKPSEIDKIVEIYLESASSNVSSTSLKEKKQKRKEYINNWHKKRALYFPVRKVLSDIKHRKSVRHDVKMLMCSLMEQWDSKDIRYYNKHLSTDMKDEPYIYFALQLTPESTTLPWAGIFSNQLYTIRILAEISRIYGVKVYVKEHWIQGYRPANFYRELSGIPNVVCMDAAMDSYPLIDGCLAVATQTGSCITESIIKGKPAIVFTKGWWDAAANVFVVDTKKTLSDAMERIVNKKPEYDPDENKDRYFNAVKNSFIRWKLDYDEVDFLSDSEIEEDAVDLITKFVKSGMKEEFIYARG